MVRFLSIDDVLWYIIILIIIVLNVDDATNK